MRFIQEFGYTVRAGQEEAHQRWLIEHHDEMVAAAPPGTRYLGTFAVIYSSEKGAGGYKTLMELDSYASLDTSAAAAKDPDDAWSKLVREANRFLDPSWSVPWSNALLKDINDATVWDIG